MKPKPIPLLFAKTHPYHQLLYPMRYKVLVSGRGSGKSWTIAEYLIRICREATVKVLCAREYQNSIQESCHALLSNTITRLEVENEFIITKTSIIHSETGSEFIFKGLAKDPAQIKSLEGVDICWLEEADLVSKESWDFLLPTIRKQDSEIIISFNPSTERTETYKRFVLNPPKNSVLMIANYDKNPFCSQTLIDEALECKEKSLETYENRWLGNPLKIHEAVIFKNKYVVEKFELDYTFDNVFHGIDFGWNDTNAFVRCYLKNNELWVDKVIGANKLNNTELAELIAPFVKPKNSKVYGDSSRPETINSLRNKGLNIVSVKKGAGSIVDGITFLQDLKQIHIHEDCKELIEEFETYSWKKDKNGEVLNIPEDKNCHYLDALRYSLADLILNDNKVEYWKMIGDNFL